MKFYDVLLHRLANPEELKSVEIEASNEDEARREAARLYGSLDWVVQSCMPMREYELLCVETEGRIGDPTNQTITVFASDEEAAREKAEIPAGYRSAGIREIIKVEGYENFTVTE